MVKLAQPLRVHGDQRLRLRRRGVRRLPAAQLPGRRRAPRDVGVEFTTMSKGYNMAGWRVGFCCGNAEMVRALAHDQGLLRLRHVPGDPDRRDRRPAAHRGGRRGASRKSTRAAATCCATACDASAGTITPPKAGMFVWAKIPEPWASQMGTMDFAMKLLGQGRRGRQPRQRFRPGRRRLSADGAGRERRTGCGRPCGRSRPACAKRRLAPRRLPRNRRRLERDRLIEQPLPAYNAGNIRPTGAHSCPSNSPPIKSPPTAATATS